MKHKPLNVQFHFHPWKKTVAKEERNEEEEDNSAESIRCNEKVQSCLWVVQLLKKWMGCTSSTDAQDDSIECETKL